MVLAATPTTTTRNGPTPTSGSADGDKYTVQRGDNLTHIAQAHDVELRDLIAANPQIKNPNLIYPGQELNIPAARPDDPAADPVSRPRRPSNGGVPQPHNGGLDSDTLRSGIEQRSALRRGSTGPQVSELQDRLRELGHDPGASDGVFGARTHQAVRDFQRSQNLSPDGVVGPDTRRALENPQRAEPIRTPDGTPGSAPRLQVYEPNSPEAVALFRDAARLAGVPESWASSPGLHNILRRESNGRVGVPNYTYGERARDPSRWGEVHDELRNGRITARSSATGLGQLLLSNVDRYYPAGRAGIGDPVQEAAGMLAYIKDRYGSPERAWALYGTRHEGY